MNIEVRPASFDEGRLVLQQGESVILVQESEVQLLSHALFAGRAALKKRRFYRKETREATRG